MQNISAHLGLFAAAILCYIISFIGDFIIAWALYVLLASVNRALSFGLTRMVEFGMISKILAFGLCGAAFGQSLTVKKVDHPPATTALMISVGGRTLSTSAVALSGFGSTNYQSQWPGTYFKASFKGTDVYFRVGKSDEILHVTIDEQVPLKLVKPEVGTYQVSGMVNGVHTVQVAVVTESQSAPNNFGGFGIPDGETALPPSRQPRQMEFIGDSHTVGYGNTSNKRECTNEDVWATTDSSQVYGALTARHYRADFQINAISGHGLIRNYNGSSGDPVPVAYPYMLFDKKQQYADPAWSPQIIVASLGTNDFSTPLNLGEKWKTRDELRADYEATYVRFVEYLRSRNPQAYIVLWATELADGEIDVEARKVVSQLQHQGEQKIAYIPIQGLSFSACHYHPSLADEKAISEKLVQFIDAHPAIWQGR